MVVVVQIIAFIHLTEPATSEQFQRQVPIVNQSPVRFCQGAVTLFICQPESLFIRGQLNLPIPQIR